ncbi:uncharacterized protein [Venturia canescens]|uniref:uncharacterized protein n=1 Tax=Venturia canescens TaxID=32260 RepID=UPI001C9C147E|nr:uncharacterized protein LOC122406636 [Venturia canescens]XP_043268126.1 uncharacterized protein LOC122406636 [Venturia canescens]
MLLLIIIIATLTLPTDGKRFYITSSGVCTDCRWSEDQEYQWCTADTLDYCSTSPGYSSKNKKCKSDHACDEHGYGYMWCYLEEGGWDYCSLIEDTTAKQFTYTAKECQSYCDIKDKDYKCRSTDHTYEHCSLIDALTSDGKACRHESNNDETYCSPHSYAYKWCRVFGGSWGYCSRVEFDDSLLKTDVGTWRKRARTSTCEHSGATIVHQTEQHLANRSRLVTTIFCKNHDSSIIQRATGTWLTDARTVLYRWHARLSSDRPLHSTTEQSNGRIRLDRQGVFSNSYGNFINFQLQINDEPIRPSTVAQVNIASNLQGYDLRGYRRILVTGLHYSLNTGGRVWILQQRLGPRDEAQCPRQ